MGPAAAAAPDEAAGTGADPGRHRRGRRRNRLRRELHEPRARPDGAAGGADVSGDAARVREPPGFGVDLLVRPAVFAGESGTARKYVPAGQHVLVPGRAPDHDTGHVSDTENVSDDDQASDQISDTDTDTDHVYAGFDAYAYSHSHEPDIATPASAFVAFVRVHHPHFGQHARVPADVRSALVTGGASG